MPKKKTLIHAPKTCGGEFQEEMSEDDFPYLICDKCERRIDDWIKWYREYQYFYQDEERWKDKQHHLVCLLGYFCCLYKNHYGLDFTLSLTPKGLFRGTEIFMMRKTYKMFDGNPFLMREYLDWVFKTKVVKRKKRITSLGFLSVPEVVREFKLAKKKSQIRTRDTPLPPKMKLWVEKFAPSVADNIELSDFGDLKLFLKYYKSGNFQDEDSKNFVSALRNKQYVDANLDIINWRS